MRDEGTSDHPTVRAEGDPTGLITQGEILREPLLGQQLDDCHVLSCVGKGGFGAVYRARDIHLRRDVAIKFLNRAVEPDDLEEFAEEARLLASSGSHPHIVHIYRWGVHEGRPYFVMEYLPESLQHVLEHQRCGLPWREAVRIALACGRALAHLHRQGVLHRDVKPGNILVDMANGTVKLTDFGLSGYRERIGQSVLAGSPPYIAPELYDGRAPDERSDVYALGATLWRMLLGLDTPLPGTARAGGADAAELLDESRQALPAELRHVLVRALARNPDQRYDSAGALLADLESLSRAEGIFRSRARQLVWGLTAAAVIVTLAYMLPGLRPGGRGGAIPAGVAPSSLVTAEASLARGAYADAAARYEEYLEAAPDSGEAHYGLGFAWLGMGEFERAGEAFGHIGEENLRMEGLATVLFAREGEAARPELLQMALRTGAPYVHVLLARLDAARGDAAAARERLSGLDPDRLRAPWQVAHYQRVLGQALFHEDDLIGADALFARLRGSSTQDDTAATDAYRALIAARMNGQASGGIPERLARIRENMAAMAGDPEATPPPWSSTPLRFCVLPGAAGPPGSRAWEEDAVTLFPWLFSQALAGISPMTPVDRALIDGVLREYELVSALGGGEGGALLGRVLGADILLRASFARGGDGTLLYLRMVDTATTQQYPLPIIPWPDGQTLGGLAEEAARIALEVLHEKRPLRGIVRVEDGQAWLDVGRDAGVQSGQVFAPVSDPERRIPLPGKTVVVGASVLADRAPVELRGFDARDIPGGGLYVMEATPD